MKKLILLSVGWLVLVAGNQAKAQTDSSFEQAAGLIRKLQASLNTQPVSFNVKYVYSNEHAAAEVLDSVSGTIDMNGSNYRCVMENTETVHNERYNIVLFKDDKIMYLAKTSADQAPTDPTGLMMSLIKNAGGQKCNVSSKGRNKIIRIDFKDEGRCKQIEISMDTVLMRLTTVSYIVRTTMLMESAEKSPGDGYEPYALVKASFYNYTKLPAEQPWLQEHHFFYKEGNEFKVTNAFMDYKLFIGTPNL